MADCVPFRLYVGEAIESVVEVLVAGMKRRGDSVACSSGSGNFSIATPIGSLQGKFKIAGKSLLVTITSRPAFVSCGTVESKLQDFILDAKAEIKNRPT